MFLKETVDNFLTLAKHWMDYYSRQDIDTLHVSISDGNDKIGHAWNVSLLPIVTCPNCSECKYLCYDIRDCIRYGEDGATIKARARNTVILLKDRERFFSEVDAFLSTRRKHKYFRWHVGGEIKDTAYAVEMLEIARRHADWTFWTYTKNYCAMNQAIDSAGGRDGVPANMHIMFSEWRGMRLDNPHGMPEFRVVFKGETEPVGYYCPGNCDICKSAHRGCIASETTYCREH